MIETGSRRSADRRTAKRFERSVHREACRPLGIRSPQRQFSPVKRVDAGDDGFIILGSQHGHSRKGEALSGPSGLEAVACMQRSDPEPPLSGTFSLGEPVASRKGMRIQLTGGRANECRAVRQ